MRRPDRPRDLEVDLLHYPIEDVGLNEPLSRGCHFRNVFG